MGGKKNTPAHFLLSNWASMPLSLIPKFIGRQKRKRKEKEKKSNNFFSWRKSRGKSQIADLHDAYRKSMTMTDLQAGCCLTQVQEV